MSTVLIYEIPLKKEIEHNGNNRNFLTVDKVTFLLIKSPIIAIIFLLCVIVIK